MRGAGEIVQSLLWGRRVGGRGTRVGSVNLALLRGRKTAKTNDLGERWNAGETSGLAS